MRSRKTALLACGAALVLIVFVTAGAFGVSTSLGVPGALASASSGHTVNLPQGGHFNPEAVPQGVVSREAAVKTAISQSDAQRPVGTLAPDVQVSAQYGLFLDGQTTGTPQRLMFQRVPIWLVTFSGPGLTILGVGAQGSSVSAGQGGKHAEDVVIDATSGKWIMTCG